MASFTQGDGDRLVAPFLMAFGEGSFMEIASSLQDLIVMSSSSAESQVAVGKENVLSAVFMILSSSLKKPVENNNAKVIAELPLAEKQALVERALWLLVRISRRELDKSTANQSNMKLIENQADSFSIIVDAANQHQEGSEGIATAFCWLVMVLASDSSERQFLLTKAGATATVAEIMKKHFENREIAEFSCRAARNLAAGEDDIVAKLVEDGACEAVIKIVETYKEKDVAVTEAALWTIVNLSTDERVATILGSVGAIDCVAEVAELWTDKYTSSTANALISAMRNLSAAGTLNYSLLSRSRISEHVIRLLTRYADEDVDLAETGLWCITNLSCDLTLSKQLGSLGAADAIVSTYQKIVPNHPAEGIPAGPISEAALWAITNLSAGNEENEYKLGQAGAVKLVGTSLGNYMHREGMVEIAIGALVHLAFHCVKNKLLIGGCEDDSEGVFPSVCEGVRKYLSVKEICEAGLRLFVLCIDHDDCLPNKKRLNDVNVCLLAVECMTAHHAVEEILRLGCELLLHLKYNSPIHRDTLKGLNQLSEEGKAKPTGTFEEIASAWEFTSLRGAAALGETM